MSFASILGGLGDALSVGAGGKANYQDRQNDLAFEKGFGKYQENPAGPGLAAMMGIDRKNAIDFSQNQDLARYQTGKNAVDAAAQQTNAQKEAEAKDERSRQLYLGMMRAATPETWQAMREAADRQATQRGWKPDFPIPDKYQDGWAQRISQTGMDADHAAKLEGDQAYRDATLNLNERKANADVAIRTGQLKVNAANIGSQAQQQAARTGVTAAIGSGRTAVSAFRADHPSKGRGIGGGVPIIAPPGTPSPGARKLDKLTHTVWYEKNGKWTHD